MISYKFLNKNIRNKVAWFAVLTSAFAVLILININIEINKNVIFFISSVVSFILIMVQIKKAGKTFDEIIIMEDSFKFYFLNKAKVPLIVKKDQTLVTIYDKYLCINDKETGKEIGRAFKESIEESEKWELLLHDLK